MEPHDARIWIEQANLADLFTKFGEAGLDSIWFKDHTVTAYMFNRMQFLWHALDQQQRDSILAQSYWTHRKNL